MCPGQKVPIKERIVWWAVLFPKDQFRKRDAVLRSIGAEGNEMNLKPDLARHNTLPVSPFLVLSEVGS